MKPSQILVAAGLIVQILGLVATWLILDRIRSETLDSAENDLRQIDLLLTEQVDRVFQSIDAGLDQISRHLQLDQPIAEEEIQSILRLTAPLLPGVRMVFISDGDGQVLQTSTADPGFAAGFSEHRGIVTLQDVASDRLHISQPVHGRTDQLWTFFASRRITRIRDTAGAIISAAIDLNYFDGLFQSMKLLDWMNFTLMNENFVLLARHPWIDSAVGRNLSHAPATRQMFILGRTAGSGRFPSAIDGQIRIVAARFLANYPLLVSVSIPEQRVLANWLDHAFNVWCYVAATSLLFTSLLVLLYQQFVRRELYETNLIASNRALARSEERLRAILDASSDGFWEFDAATARVTLSERHLRLLDAGPEILDLDRPRMEALVHPEDLARFREGFTTLLGGGDAGLAEYRLRRRDGSYVWVLSKASPVTAPTGDTTRVIGAHTDISVQKRAELEAARQAARLHTAISVMPNGFIMFDNDLKLVVYNRRFLELWELSDDEIRAHANITSLSRFFAERGDYGPGDPQTMAEQRVQRILREDSRTYELIRKGGQVLEIQAFGRSELGYILTYLDITERKRVEVEMIQARQAAEAANRAKSAFLSTISHEIRTPLNGVIGMSELLRHADLSPKHRQMVNAIYQAGNELFGIVNDILDFTRIESGPIEIETRMIVPEQMLSRVQDLVEWRAAQKGLELVIRLAPEMPPAVIGDEPRITQILVHLIDNAIKFTDAGSISLSLGGRPGTHGVWQTRFEVADTGIGIPEEGKALIFEQFWQVDSSLSRHHGGTGLGLAISKALCTRMGGTIGVISQVGQGSTFWFELPLPVATAEALPSSGLVLTGA